MDWVAITNRLRSGYGSLERVAREVNSCPVHLRRLARGEVNDTKFKTGLRLLDLHYDKFPEQHKNLKL